MASAATAEMGARRGNPLGRRLDDRRSLGTGEAGLFLGEGGFDFLSGEDKGNEYGFAFSTGIGGKARESVASVGEFFNV